MYITKSGKITAIRGKAQASPELPADTLLLNKVIIPSYPTLPMFVSNNVYEIISTKVANEKFIQTRTDKKRITTSLTARDIALEQPKRYTMSDIGNLDRRLRNVEYYVALSLVEQRVKDQVIPSSVSPDINRFKYGFFTDNFDNSRLSDLGNPEYHADNVDNKIVPPQEIINIIHSNTVSTVAPYTNYKILSQINATQAANTSTNTASNTSTNTVITTPTGTRTVSLYANQANRTRYTSTSKFVEPLQTVTMSSIANTATIWYDMHSIADEIFVYQGDTLILTGNNAVTLTTDEMNALNLDPFYENKVTLTVAPTGAGMIKESGKIVINHTPAAGRVYTIKVLKNSTIWRYRLDYPDKYFEGY